MPMFQPDEKIDDIAAKIRCFASIGSVWYFRADIGIEVWGVIMKRRNSKKFKRAFNGDGALIIWRTR